jgi:peptidyl-prolyl cis-trans isomerase SurA
MKTTLLVLSTLLAVSPAVAQQKPARKSPAPPAAASPAPSKVTLQDRVLAVVDDDPVLDSDVERVVRLGLETPKPGEGDEPFRRRVRDELIEQRLQFHEIDRFGFEQVPVSEIEKRVAAIRARFPDDAAFQKALREVGLDSKRLRQLVARQLLVLTYVDERLGVNVFVTPEDISRYYREVLTPEMRKRGQPPPPPEDVGDDIRETLKQQKITAEMTKWTQGLREKADVVIYPATRSDRPLPPVVKTIRGAQKPQTPQKKNDAKKPPR